MLDEAGIESILTRTKSRFERFEDIRAGVGAITDYLEEEINVKVGYDPTCQFLSFDYYSKETGKLLRWDVVLLGTLVDKLTELAKIMNKDPEQLFLEIMEEKFGRGDNAET